MTSDKSYFPMVSLVYPSSEEKTKMIRRNINPAKRRLKGLLDKWWRIRAITDAQFSSLNLHIPQRGSNQVALIVIIVAPARPSEAFAFITNNLEVRTQKNLKDKLKKKFIHNFDVLKSKILEQGICKHSYVVNRLHFNYPVIQQPCAVFSREMFLQSF